MSNARDSNDTLTFVTSQHALGVLLSPARMAPYLTASNGDQKKAVDLYLWATELAGALHAQISFVELAVRNALDPHLATWNATHGSAVVEWTAVGGAGPALYTLLGKDIKQARTRAQRDASIRAHNHPRHGAAVTHDDLVAQLMFGSWVKVLRPMSSTESSAKQQGLWLQGIHRAFPGVTASDTDRVRIGGQLDSLRYLRNRVAHHDNLLTVSVKHRLNEMLSILSNIDSNYSTLAMARSTVRRLMREDPRLNW